MLKDKSMFGVAQVFEEAGNIMRQRGLCKGGLEDNEGHVCFAGAVRLAESGVQEESEAMDMVYYFDADPVEFGIHNLIYINDEPKTTTEDMASWLDAMSSLYLSEAVAVGELD